MWFVYIVRCADDTLYTGIAKDVTRRIEEHNSNNVLAASYTRARRPVALVHREAVKTRSAAARREYEIKQMTRLEKEYLIGQRGVKMESSKEQFPTAEYDEFAKT